MWDETLLEDDDHEIVQRGHILNARAVIETVIDRVESMIIKEVVDAWTVYLSPLLPARTPTEHRLQQRGHMEDGMGVLLDVESEQRH